MHIIYNIIHELLDGNAPFFLINFEYFLLLLLAFHQMHGCNILDWMIVVSGLKMHVALDGSTICITLLFLWSCYCIIHSMYLVPMCSLLWGQLGPRVWFHFND
ncbi:hypothetical protein AAZV13_13G223450 [Glycine max]